MVLQTTVSSVVTSPWHHIVENKATVVQVVETLNETDVVNKLQMDHRKQRLLLAEVFDDGHVGSGDHKIQDVLDGPHVGSDDHKIQGVHKQGLLEETLQEGVERRGRRHRHRRHRHRRLPSSIFTTTTTLNSSSDLKDYL